MRKMKFVLEILTEPMSDGYIKGLLMDEDNIMWVKIISKETIENTNKYK